MDGDVKENAGPGFMHGTEVARYGGKQPGFDEQLSLIKQEEELRKKIKIAVLVIAGVFLGGLIAGAVAGIFI